MDVCPICLDTLENSAYTAICNHTFHKSCLSTWLMDNATCPMCRRPCVIDPLPRYRVWSPCGEHMWCSIFERILSWYISFEGDNIVLSSCRGRRFSIDVRQVKEVAIYGQTVEVSYILEPYRNLHDCKTFVINSANPTKLVGAIGCFFYTCKKHHDSAVQATHQLTMSSSI